MVRKTDGGWLAGIDPGLIKLIKWSVMVSALLWTLVFQLGGEGSTLPDFVYVNF